MTLPFYKKQNESVSNVILGCHNRKTFLPWMIKLLFLSLSSVDVVTEVCLKAYEGTHITEGPDPKDKEHGDNQQKGSGPSVPDLALTRLERYGHYNLPLQQERQLLCNYRQYRPLR